MDVLRGVAEGIRTVSVARGPIVLTGNHLTRADLVQVARRGAPVRIAPEALRTMAEHRRVLESAAAGGTPIYGTTTGVGVLKRVDVGGPAADRYAGRLLDYHRAAQGDDAPDDLVRATMLRLANAFVSGTPGVRPILAERLVDALVSGRSPRMRVLGSVGVGDLLPLADLAGELFGDIELHAGEGLALVGSTAFATAAAALALDDVATLLDSMDGSAALAWEGFGGTGSALHPAIGEVRPYPGLQRSLAALSSLLSSSALVAGTAGRTIQDPLSFRDIPQLLGACHDAFTHVDGLLAIELNASQANPIVVPDHDAVLSGGNFDNVGLAAGLDYLRIVLASVLTAAGERVVKLLGAPWSRLATGLADGSDPSDAGLSYLGIAVQSLVAEARSLAAPVSFELVSSAHAEGIEDRMTMAPLAARRVTDQVRLAERIVAIELLVGTTAVERRGHGSSGAGTTRLREAVRTLVPAPGPRDPVPDLTPLVAAVRSGTIAALVRDMTGAGRSSG